MVGFSGAGHTLEQTAVVGRWSRCAWAYRDISPILPVIDLDGCATGLAMEISWAIAGWIFASGVCAGGLVAVVVQWIYNEWLWRIDRCSMQPMPELSDALLKKATMAALLEMIEYRDQGDDYVMPPTPDLGSGVNQWGEMVEDFEGPEGIS